MSGTISSERASYIALTGKLGQSLMVFRVTPPFGEIKNIFKGVGNYRIGIMSNNETAAALDVSDRRD